MITEISRRCELKIEATPPRLGQVRRIVQAYLKYWRLNPMIDPALLGITELLANVYRHAKPSKRCTLELAYRPGRLTVSVHDADPRQPVVGGLEPLGDGGRGMTIVAAVSDSWGSRPETATGGKVVWFTLDDPLPASPAAVSLAPEYPQHATRVHYSAALAGPAVPAGPR